MEQMTNHGTGWVRMEFLVPRRGLIGFRTEFLTETRGTGIAHHVFDGTSPGAGRSRPGSPARWSPTAPVRPRHTRCSTSRNAGSLFVDPDHRGLRGHDRRGELPRRRHGRQHHQGKEAHQRAGLLDCGQLRAVVPPRRLSLEQSLEFCREDECVEVTPDAVRIRKVELDQVVRARTAARARAAARQS
jgi:GTP-binding protein